MSRNFGLGSRDMGTAGQYALNNAAQSGGVSFSTAATNGDRWQSFADWAKEEGVKKMENVTAELVKEYGKELAEKVNSGEMAAATAQNYVSAINSVMAIATQGDWKSVSPTKDCSISERSHVRQDAPGALDRTAYSRALDAVRAEVGERAAAVVELARELGLRSKEASLLDARAALDEAKERGAITVDAGTKGGREREVPITSQAQVQALERAAAAQGGDRSMVPEGQSWASWREGELRDAREVVQEHTGGGLHDLRAAFACQRYETLAGHAAPCTGAAIQDRDRDAAARLAISEELGHGRADVTSEYVGGRS
ncbi:tyrosine-type recombinase/integrase [Vibrio fluvialis]|uniref:tyrosine-type recombinase/integrase n=1 Tax=Vibrio fluvialis TaxID=676 RepID=UPI00301E14A8